MIKRLVRKIGGGLLLGLFFIFSEEVLMKLLEGRLVFSGLLGGIDIDGNCGIFFN